MLGRLLPIYRLNLGAVLGSGKQWFSWIGLQDLVQIYVAAIEKTEINGPVNAVAPRPIRNRDFTHQLARALHKKAFLRVPGWFLYVGGADIANSLLGSQRVKPTKLTAEKFVYETPSVQSAVETS
jgi:NAD dependent epimerase/dehydratase family enzyme